MNVQMHSYASCEANSSTLLASAGVNLILGLDIWQLLDEVTKTNLSKWEQGSTIAA
jgi:hypothetical protein